jgi:hypothetical protein
VTGDERLSSFYGSEGWGSSPSERAGLPPGHSPAGPMRALLGSRRENIGENIRRSKGSASPPSKDAKSVRADPSVLLTRPDRLRDVRPWSQSCAEYGYQLGYQQRGADRGTFPSGAPSRYRRFILDQPVSRATERADR